MSRESDYHFNEARLLRQRLEAVRQPDPASNRKAKLHDWLDRVQSVTPGFVRAAVRPLYLHLFYRPLFAGTRAEPAPIENPLTCWSGYAPFVAYKARVCRELSMDLRGFGFPCERGLVSVVLPVFNGATFLKEAIESVLAQSYGRFELIVLDDGSTDASAAIASEFLSDARVRLIRQENRKLPAALNRGFADARGEYFTWVSADNVMKPAMLAELIAFLEANGNAEMVYADEEFIGDRSGPRAHPLDPGPLSFGGENYIGGCFLYRSWAARIVGEYDPACFGFEDLDYWLRMTALFRIAHLGTRNILHSYRLHEESLTSHAAELQLAERTRYFLALEEERRRFFAESFDIEFEGEHPWFEALASAYRRSGHNVVESDRMRAFPKRFVVKPSEIFEAAPNAETLAYPLLALANRTLWESLAGKQARLRKPEIVA